MKKTLNINNKTVEFYKDLTPSETEEIGNTVRRMPKGAEFWAKTEKNLIDGCQSRVWLQADLKEGLVHFQAESDALIVRGLVALLVRVLSDHTPQEILDADLYFIPQIGLSEHLSPTRSNGLLAMLKQMKLYALAFKAESC